MGVALGVFFQAEDGIRDLTVTGVQTCALPISVGATYQLEAKKLAGADIFLDEPSVTATENALMAAVAAPGDRKSTRLNSSHSQISYAVFCLKKKNEACSLQHPKPKILFTMRMQ